MITIIADAHTHTVACNHAYSTISENAAAAAAKGLKSICFTEHGPVFPGGADPLFFTNFQAIPDEMHGVEVLCGIEVDILDMEGNLALADGQLSKLDWVIASFHELLTAPVSKDAHTECILRLSAHPHIRMFGHLDNGMYPLDYERVVRAAAEHGKAVELNNNSLKNRLGAVENATELLRLCRKHGVGVILSSDAHHCSKVGEFSVALQLLEELAFPEELVINADIDRWNAYRAQFSKQ